MHLLLLLASAATFGGDSLSTSVPAVRGQITPNIDANAVWLLESAAAKLRSANTLRAIVQRVEYDGPGDAQPTGIAIDSVILRRDGAASLRSRERGPSSTSFEHIAMTRSGCYREYTDATIAPAATPLQRALATAATLVLKPGVSECSSESGRQAVTRGNIVHLFFPLPPGRQLEVGQWDIDRLHDPLVRSVTYDGVTECGGESCDVVQWVYERAYPLPSDTVVYTTRVWIGLDRTIRRMLTTSTKGFRWDEQVKALALDGPVSDAELAWKPPAGVTVNKQVPTKTIPTSVGGKLPPLTTPVTLLDGSPVTSDQLLAKKNGALVWFWNTGCGSCIAEMPHFEQMYRELHESGIAVIAVDVNPDTAEHAHAVVYQKFYGITMPIVFGAQAWGDWLDHHSPFAILDANGTIVADAPSTDSSLGAIRTQLRRLTQHWVIEAPPAQ